MLRFDSDYLKTKKMSKNSAKTLPIVIKCVPHRYKTQTMCDKDILENGGTIMFICNCLQESKNV